MLLYIDQVGSYFCGAHNANPLFSLRTSIRWEDLWSPAITMGIDIVKQEMMIPNCSSTYMLVLVSQFNIYVNKGVL
uniref:Uncharacterized protein n=1 Tax=Rhizophora mucronata TaxID=61149 RepID=A0A2P2NMF3_RHIMU